ncbi:hypothetical protein GWN42_06430 [candidate division KSB1 bacterium]|nr:hypothetical protein [candidate division KSB1 bacterium]
MADKTYLQLDEIKGIIESAFAPYRCVIEFWDYDERVRFKVYDTSNVQIIAVPELEIHEVDKAELESILYPYQEEIRRKGFSLG